MRMQCMGKGGYEAKKVQLQDCKHSFTCKGCNHSVWGLVNLLTLELLLSAQVGK